MRCYQNNNGTAQIFSYHFNSEDSIQCSSWGFSNVSYPGYIFMAKEGYYVPDKKWLYQMGKLPKNRFVTPKVVVIVNEYTQSQAELHVMVYQTAPDVVVIGSTTVGADGTITNFKLPGNVRVSLK